MAHTHALTFFVAKGMLDAGAGMDVPFAPPSFQAISRTIETVRSDAGHLFAAIQRENPFAGEARRQLLEALVQIDQALEAPPADRPPDSARFAIPDLGARSPELQETRELIDEVWTARWSACLARRVTLARRAGKAKAELGHPIVDPEREARLLAERRAWADALQLDPEGMDELFRAILRFSRRAQRPPIRRHPGMTKTRAALAARLSMGLLLLAAPVSARPRRSLPWRRGSSPCAGRLVDPATGRIATDQIILVEGNGSRPIGATSPFPPAPRSSISRR